MYKPKLISCLKHYDKKTLSADIMAGIIVGIVALPLAIAFGIASGVSPEKGIITAIVAGLLVSVFGGSKRCTVDLTKIMSAQTPVYTCQTSSFHPSRFNLVKQIK